MHRVLCALLLCIPLTTTGCETGVVDSDVPLMPVARYVFPTPDLVGLTYENIELEASNGETIYAWFIPKENARATVLINHGAVFSRSWPLPQIVMFHDLGCHVMIADYQGFGESTGVATIGTVLGDANTSLTYVRSCGREGTDRIVLYGVSMGTMPAMAQAADALPDIVGLMIEGTVELESLTDLGYEFMGIRPSAGASSFIPAELDPLLTAPRIVTPTLFLQSAEDAITPFAGAERLFNHCPGPKRLITLVGIHGLGVFMDPGYADFVSDFLDEVAPMSVQ